MATARRVSESALLVEFADLDDEAANGQAVRLAAALSAAGIREAVVGARTLWVAFDRSILTEAAVRALVQAPVGQHAPLGRDVQVDVLFAGEDLPEVARMRGLTESQVVEAFTHATYRAAFMGFAPGFAYLTGLPPQLEVPRLSTPRYKVAAGSVAIASRYAGIYPAQSPGGWRILGRAQVPALRPGDTVSFRRVEALPPALEPKPVPLADPVLWVTEPGPSTTIQGPKAMDPLSLAHANAALGQAWDAPGLEATLLGPTLELASAAAFAFSGSTRVQLDGEDLAPGLRHPVRAGQRLKMGPVFAGARAYLCVEGGLAGRPGPLARGDGIGRGAAGPARPGAPAQRSGSVLRVLRGPQETAAWERFVSSEYRVSPLSDRRGVRLEGPPVAVTPAEILPEGTAWGSVQVPGDGQPILLGPDRPLTGGYPKIATVAEADLSLLGQLRPGAVVRFREISLGEALRIAST